MEHNILFSRQPEIDSVIGYVDVNYAGDVDDFSSLKVSFEIELGSLDFNRQNV